MIELKGVSKSYGGSVVLSRARPHDRAGPDDGPDRAERLREVHAAPADDRPGPARHRHGHDRREGADPATVLEVRRRLGYVIQDGGLFPHLSARDNVVLMARYLGWERGRIEDRLAELAELTQFPTDGLDRFPAQLSGGQRQRVSLMRALMLDPKVILLDEPLGALDPMVRAELQADLRAIFRSLEKTVVMVTHDLAEAGWFGDEILLMRDGRIVQRGTLGALIDDPAEPFVTQFVSAQRQVLGARRRGRRMMPGLALLARAGDSWPTTARADRPGRIEDVHRVGDPGRDRPALDP